jgi:hypothetical protein
VQVLQKKQAAHELLKLAEELAALQAAPEQSDQSRRRIATIGVEVTTLEAKQRKLTKQVSDYELHLTQYETARQAAWDAEKAVQPGSMVWYRDFVNQHDSDGAKIHDYVLVMMYREVKDGPLMKLVVHNVTSDSETNMCDASMVQDMIDHHLSGESNVGDGLIMEQTAAGGGVLKLYQAGDHGPQLSGNETLYAQSAFWDKYRVEIRDGFLCSYFNPCDAGGSVGVRIADGLARKGQAPRGSGGLVHAINTSLYANHVAFNFERINRPLGQFPKLKKLPRARKMCDIRYNHWPPASESDSDGVAVLSGQVQHTVGVIRARLVPGEGTYTVWDLLPRPKNWGAMCQACSDNFQCPVYHQRDGTKCPRVGSSQPPTRRGTRQPRTSQLACAQ